jgi:replicative DNA helicase
MGAAEARLLGCCLLSRRAIGYCLSRGLHLDGPLWHCLEHHYRCGIDPSLDTIRAEVGDGLVLPAPEDAERVSFFADLFLEERFRDQLSRAVAKAQSDLSGGGAPLPVAQLLQRVQPPIAPTVPRPFSEIRLQQELDQSAFSLSFGLPGLEKLIGCLRPGLLGVIAGRPGMGKTSLALHFAARAEFPGVRLLFSLEMSDTEICHRLQDLEKCDELFIDDSSQQSVQSMALFARELEAKLVVIDYIQLVRPSDLRLPREQQISEISRGLKALAKDASCAVLVLSQLNRSSEREQRAPNLSDLRESGAIEQDADFVLFLDKAEEYRRDPAIEERRHVPRVLRLAKNRHGPVGAVAVTFDKFAQTFCENPF